MTWIQASHSPSSLEWLPDYIFYIYIYVFLLVLISACMARSVNGRGVVSSGCIKSVYAVWLQQRRYAICLILFRMRVIDFVFASLRDSPEASLYRNRRNRLRDSLI